MQKQHRSRHEELKERARVLLEAARREAAGRRVGADTAESGARNGDSAASPTSPSPDKPLSPVQLNNKPASEVRFLIRLMSENLLLCGAEQVQHRPRDLFKLGSCTLYAHYFCAKEKHSSKLTKRKMCWYGRILRITRPVWEENMPR